MSARDNVSKLLSELRSFGPVLPGRVSEQYNVCGKSECRCKDKKNPQRHGPYYQLSYTLSGKSSTRAVSQENLGAVREMTARWGELKVLERDLAAACLTLLMEGGSDALKDISVESPDQKLLEEQADIIANLEKRLLIQESECGRLKERAGKHSVKIQALRAQVRDLSKSRDKWKEKAKAKSEVENLAQKKSAH